VHVGLNLIFLIPGETGGMEIVARELIPELLARAPDDMRFTAFVNREALGSEGPWGELLPAVGVPVNARDRKQWVAGEQLLLPRLAKRKQVDLLHSLGSTAPGYGRFRRVVTVHDLIYKLYPDAHSGLRARAMSMLVPLAVRSADRVIAISESTRSDLTRLLGVSTEKIDVVPNGLGMQRRATPLPPPQARERFALDERPLLLSLSARRPHKNLLALIDALAMIEPEARPQLVVPGYPTWHERELRARVAELGLDDDVRLPDWIEGQELEGLWQLARGFVFPSLYEGFGLPVLEAMARGVPVACSNAPALAEVAGDAALLFDPRDRRAIAAAVRRLLSDDEELLHLRERGRTRAAQFTWQRSARGVLDCYARAAAQ
jgi:glycosyltransferase involved in cell wall biosynthesis